MKILKTSFILLFSLHAISSESFSEELHIPILVGQTGDSATFGKNETDAYTLAAEEWNSKGGVNGKKIILDFEDTQTVAKEVVTAFHRLSISKSPVVMGPTWLDGFPAVIPIARQNQCLLVTPSAVIEAFSKEDRNWPVTFYHNSTVEIRTLLEYLKQKKLMKIGLLYEQEPFSEMIRRIVLNESPNVVADIGVQAGEVDFETRLAKLKKSSPDVLLVFVWNQRSLLSLLGQLRIHLKDIPVATVHDGEGWLGMAAFNQVLPKIIHTKFEIADTQFTEKFVKRFSYEPILTASNAYDALNSVLTALSSGASSASDIRKYLTTTQLSSVTFGDFKFATDGSVPSKVVVIEH